MGAGDGDGDGKGKGNGTGPKAHEVTFPPCDESPCQFPFPKRPHARDRPQPQVSDPANYAVAGKILLAVAGAIAGVLLALVALHLYNSTRRRRLGAGGGGSGGQRRLLRSLAIAGGGEEDRRDGEAPSLRGLDSAVLAAIPVVVVVDAGAGKGGDCAVCLAELEPGEKARALPRCGHRFHVECIDAWFRGNVTCPLCRADVVVAVAPGAAAAPPSAPPEGGAHAQPEVRIDVAGDAAVAVAAPPANGSTVAPVIMGRLHSGGDLDKARRVFASTRFSSF